MLRLRHYLQDSTTKQWISGWWEYVFDEQDYKYLDYLTEKQLKKLACKTAASHLKGGMLIDVGEQDEENNDKKYTKNSNTKEDDAKLSAEKTNTKEDDVEQPTEKSNAKQNKAKETRQVINTEEDIIKLPSKTD